MKKWNQSYGFLFGKVLQKMETKFVEGLSPFEVNARQYGVLLFIEGNPYSSQKDISENLQIDRTTMVSHIDHLENPCHELLEVFSPQTYPKLFFAFKPKKQMIILLHSLNLILDKGLIKLYLF